MRSCNVCDTRNAFCASALLVFTTVSVSFLFPPALHTALLSVALFFGARALLAAPPARCFPPPRALLVIAHPDDEAMFFAPSLAHFGPSAHVLCLTAGEGGGDGAARRAELAMSACALGVAPERVAVRAHPRVRDGPLEAWDEDAAAALVGAEVRRLQPAVVLTFDAAGVTGHANHSATHRAVLRAAAAAGAAAPWPAVYALRTVPVARRFLFGGGFEALAAAASGARGAPPLCERPYPPALLLCAGGAWPWARAHAAMGAHASQYVLHRRLWVAFSVYALVNVLDRVVESRAALG
jgi:N-acetylglucosaminylphosphatidylinositol deacetylase